MSVVLSVPEALREKVAAFVQAEAVSIEVVTDGGGTVSVVQSSKGQESEVSKLLAGGCIACPVARATAAKLGIDGRRMGKLLDLLDIRIRECELGCFE